DKVIPVTHEAFRSHRRGGWDAFLMAVERVGAAHLMAGAGVLPRGGPAPPRRRGAGRGGGPPGAPPPPGAPGRPPPRPARAGGGGRCSPGREVASIPDWEERLEAVAGLAARQDMRLVSGMPSWLVILFERVARHRRASGRPVRDLGACWPELRVMIHGGVAFSPAPSAIDQGIRPPPRPVPGYPPPPALPAPPT